MRLQKTVYLLDQLGLGSKFEYEYWHYGPYSRDLDNATADAKAFDLIREEFDHRQSDGGMYSVFSLRADRKTRPTGRLVATSERAGPDFRPDQLTVLELAATVDWLWRHEGKADWQREITRRKPLKVQGGRLERAIDLLHAVDLPPPAPA